MAESNDQRSPCRNGSNPVYSKSFVRLFFVFFGRQVEQKGGWRKGRGANRAIVLELNSFPRRYIVFFTCRGLSVIHSFNSLMFFFLKARKKMQTIVNLDHFPNTYRIIVQKSLVELAYYWQMQRCQVSRQV